MAVKRSILGYSIQLSHVYQFFLHVFKIIMHDLSDAFGGRGALVFLCFIKTILK